MREGFVNLEKSDALKEARDNIFMREFVATLTQQTSKLISVIEEQDERIGKLEQQLWSLEVSHSSVQTTVNETAREQRSSQLRHRLLDIFIVGSAALIVGGALALCLIK